MNKSAQQLAKLYVQYHNDIVMQGQYDNFLDLLSHDVEFVFEGSDFGPFVGRQEVSDAFRGNPPPLELLILELNSSEDSVKIRFAWANDPYRSAGSFVIKVESGKITRVCVCEIANIPGAPLLNPAVD